MNLATKTRKENSAEHSWSVATMVWLLETEFKKEFGKKINFEKAIKMALMHDIVETEVKDVSVWSLKERKKAEIKEKDIFGRVVDNLPDNLKRELSELWDEFEENKTTESKIVGGVDRISAAIQRVVTGQGWAKEGHNEKGLDKIQLPKIGFSKVLRELYKNLKKEAFEKKLLEKADR